MDGRTTSGAGAEPTTSTGTSIISSFGTEGSSIVVVDVVSGAVVVILGGFFMAFSGASIITAVILVLVRFFVDFCLASIREDSLFLDYLVDKMYDDKGKMTKEEFRKQLLLFSE